MTVSLEELRSRLRTQREKLEKVRDEIGALRDTFQKAIGDWEPGSHPAVTNAADLLYSKNIGFFDSWLAALDEILNEEG